MHKNQELNLADVHRRLSMTSLDVRARVNPFRRCTGHLRTTNAYLVAAFGLKMIVRVRHKTFRTVIKTL